MKNNNIEKTEFLKIVYFDEAAAQDYVDVTNGGRLDWSTQENKEKIARACLKIKNCTKHVFLSPFHDRIKKKGAFICQDVMN